MALDLSQISLRTSSLGRIKKKFDELTAQVHVGQHKQRIVSVCDERAEQDKAWRLSAGLSANFTKDEIEAHGEEIKSYIRDSMESGDLEESSAQPEMSSYDLWASKSLDPPAKIEFPVASLAKLATLAGQPVLEHGSDVVSSAPVYQAGKDVVASSTAHKRPIAVKPRGRRTDELVEELYGLQWVDCKRFNINDTRNTLTLSDRSVLNIRK